MIHALLDTNIVLDALLDRTPWNIQANAIWDALGIVLKALRFQLSIKPLESENRDLETDTVQTAHVAESPTAPHHVTK